MLLAIVPNFLRKLLYKTKFVGHDAIASSLTLLPIDLPIFRERNFTIVRVKLQRPLLQLCTIEVKRRNKNDTNPINNLKKQKL